MTDDRRAVWIFHGEGARFASGVFDTLAEGEAWISRHHLTGILTEYEVGAGAYDLAIAAGRFTPSKPHHGSPAHVASFSPGGAHVHFADGQRD